MSSIKSVGMPEKYGADEDIDNSVAHHWPQAIVRVEPINVRSNSQTTCERIDSGILRMKSAIESDAWTKSILRNVARKQTLPAGFLQELSLLLRRFEC